jgi:hypothetical protein
MAINKRYTHLNLTGSNHSQLDAEFAYITGTLGVGGVATFNAGLSGSLTRLVDGSSYLAAGPNIIITSASNGQVTIEATTSGGSSPEYWTSDVANAIWTSGSVLARGGDTTTAASDYGTDLFFFVSGTLRGINPSGIDVAAFGGDLVVSGGMRIGDGEGGGLFVSGAIAVGNPGIPGASITVATSDVNTNIDINKSDDKSISISNNNFSTISDDITISSGTVVIRENYQYGVERPVLTLDANTIAYTVSAGGSADTLGITSAGDITLDATDKIFVTASNGMYVGANTVFNAGLSGSLQRLADGTSYLVAGPNITITSASSGQVTIEATSAAAAAVYWTETGLNAIQTTGSAGVTSNLTVGGFVTASLGFSGSLTNLIDGSSYLVAGTNVTVTSASNGQVTISATDTVGPNYWSETGLNAIESTGSVGISSNLTVGGFVTASLGFSGSLTQLADGSSYLIAGANVTITSASNGAITIAASDVVGTNYWQSTVANNIFTTGSAEISSSLSVNPAGTGRGLLRVGGLDIGPITGSAVTTSGVGNDTAVLSGDILSASFGVWDTVNTAVVRHEVHVLGIGYEDATATFQSFAATYLIMSFIEGSGIQVVKAVTELSRETSGSYAANWDVNFGANLTVQITGSIDAGAFDNVNWYGQRVKEMSLNFNQTNGGSRT